jgi:16S rRNA (uracil1498-N3)-methyltransferase
MRLHRFYVSGLHDKNGPKPLENTFWLNDERLINQWQRVLRFRPGQQLVLFDGIEHERLYKITEMDENGARLELVTDLVRQVPKKEIYLLWALLKKDKNDWVLQKCTELGVSHFLPIIADRSVRTGFSTERAEKIVIEASEQCGRSDIPKVREPIHVQSALEQLAGKIQLFVCEQGEDSGDTSALEAAGLLIGPEGGWSENEKNSFQRHDLAHLSLHDFTLRAETAAVAAVTKLIQ